MYPKVYLFGLHRVQNLSELLDFLFGICILFLAFEAVELLVVKVEVFITLVAYGVLAATYSIYRGVVMVLFGYWIVLAELLE